MSRGRNDVNPAEMELRVACELKAVRPAAAQVRAFLAGNGLAEKEIWACELAFVEGCNNAIQNTSAEHAAEPILVTVRCQAGSVELRINDHTAGFAFSSRTELPADESEHGRGIFLMRSLMDEVDYIRKGSGNCLVLRKSVTGI